MGEGNNLMENVLVGRLCDDVWVEIFTYLNIYDLGRVQLVCKTFYKLCQEPIVWRKVFHSHFDFDQRDFVPLTDSHEEGLINYKEEAKRTLQIPCKLERTIKAHQDEVLHACWSPDGKHLASV